MEKHYITYKCKQCGKKVWMLTDYPEYSSPADAMRETNTVKWHTCRENVFGRLEPTGYFIGDYGEQEEGEYD